MIDSLDRKYNIAQASRASAILYRILTSQKHKKTWLLPANICPIVPITFMKAQTPFELVDISVANLHMDLDQAEALVKQQAIGGLLYTHTYGEASTPDDFFQSLKSINPELIIVDDRCLCIPEFEVASSADVILFSTGYAKIVELGLGGYAFINDGIQYQPSHLTFHSDHYAKLENEYKQALNQRNYFVYHDSDWLETDRQLPLWYDYRVQIESATKLAMHQRVRLNQIYAALLPIEIQLPQDYQAWRFNIRLKNKERTLKAIFEGGLFASSHYASLAGVMSEGRAMNAERLAGEVVNLFNDDHFNEAQAEKVCKIILKNA